MERCVGALLAVLVGVFARSTIEAHRVDDPSRRAARRVEVHGHRGARGLVPENTLPGFETALDLGVDALESDLRLTADAVVVVAHDAHVRRAICGFDAAVTGPPAPDPDRMPNDAAALRIEALTFAQLARYRCDRNPDAHRFPAQRHAAAIVAGADYGIPSLEALFAFVEAYAVDPRKPLALRANARRVRFNLETKPGPGARGPLERAVVAAIARHGLERRVLLQSFDPRSLAMVHRLAPSLPLAYLTRSPFAGPEDAAALGVEYWSPNFRYLTAAEVRAAHALGLRVLPYTVDELDNLRETLGLGVDGIISDCPDRLLTLVGRSQHR